MKHISSIEVNDSSREEISPGFPLEFPYIAACAELEKYPEPFAPWHRHRPAGSGGFVNSIVLQISRFQKAQNSLN